MGNPYKYTTNQQLQHQNSFNSSRNFLPLLCRLSIKDVKFPKWSDSDRSSSSSSDEDPSSPKVSCIGQVKKRGNNKLITTATAPKSADNFKYNKLRKLFSGKNLLTTATAPTKFDSSHSCKIRTTKDQVIIRNGSTGMRSRMAQPNVNVLELDPPLPVVKKVQQPGGDELNLWKRRCGSGNGVGLRSLQIQQPTNNLLLPPTTV